MTFIPQVSVIIAVYNSENYIAEALESVLSQTFTDWECIIVDDGSNDDTQEVIKLFLSDKRIKYIYQKNRGAASARNRALYNSKGKYIAVLDSDDVCLKDRLEIEYDYLENNRLCVAVGSNAHVIDRNGNYLYTSDLMISWEEIKLRLPQMPFFNSSTLFRRDIALKCGGYNENFLTAQDCLLFNQMAKYGELRNVKTPLIKYRIVPSAISIRSTEDGNKILKIIENTVKSEELSDNDFLELKKIYNRGNKFYKLSNYYLRIGKILIEKNFNRVKAFKNLLYSIYYNPYNVTAFFNLFLLLFPRQIIKMWKRHRVAN